MYLFDFMSAVLDYVIITHGSSLSTMLFRETKFETSLPDIVITKRKYFMLFFSLHEHEHVIFQLRLFDFLTSLLYLLH